MPATNSVEQFKVLAAFQRCGYAFRANLICGQLFLVVVSVDHSRPLTNYFVISGQVFTIQGHMQKDGTVCYIVKKGTISKKVVDQKVS